jgi:hypothetical protein
MLLAVQCEWSTDLFGPLAYYTLPFMQLIHADCFGQKVLGLIASHAVAEFITNFLPSYLIGMESGGSKTFSPPAVFHQVTSNSSMKRQPTIIVQPSAPQILCRRNVVMKQNLQESAAHNEDL